MPGTDQKRSYSFSSPPGSHEVSFLVRNIPGGLMSSYLRERAKPGDAAGVHRPVRQLLPARHKAAGAVAGRRHRAGALPVDARQGREGRAASSRSTWSTASPTIADLVGVEQLEAFAKQIPNFTFTCCVADEGSRLPAQGLRHPHIEPKHLNGGDVDVYLCGPPPMVEAVRTWLARSGRHAGEFLLREVLAERRGNGRRRGPSQMTERRRFEGKAAVVTGAAQGIGRTSP